MKNGTAQNKKYVVASNHDTRIGRHKGDLCIKFGELFPASCANVHRVLRKHEGMYYAKSAVMGMIS